MKYLMIEDRATGERQMASLEEAEAITEIDRHEITWAIEECSVCDAIDHIITDTRPAEEIAALAAMEAEAA